MQIAPVSYNYTNSKVQKNNSKPAFGMAMSERMASTMSDHAEQIIKLGAEGKTSLLENIAIIREHNLLVDVLEGRFKIFSSPAGVCIRPVEQGITFDASLDNIARDLRQHDELVVAKQQRRLALDDLARDISTQKLALEDLRIRNRDALLSGEIKTQKDCQAAHDAVHEAEESLRLKQRRLASEREPFNVAVKNLSDFFPETVKPEEAK